MLNQYSKTTLVIRKNSSGFTFFCRLINICRLSKFLWHIWFDIIAVNVTLKMEEEVEVEGKKFQRITLMQKCDPSSTFFL